MERIRLDDLQNKTLVDDSEEDSLRRRMAGLQLPHMPEFLSSPTGVKKQVSSSPATSTTATADSLPQLRVLVVADLDLPSAAALAEYTLQQRNRVFDASRIDLCIACGPFSRDEDLRAYQSRRPRKRPNKTVQQSPFVRSREETAALEGLVTAALSQLENIVCRVVFCPGSTDPLTTILPGEDGREKLRLTPNSRNIHQQWLPLAPSLGCAGLLYLESPEKVMPKDTTDSTQHFSSEDDDEDDDEEKQASVEDILSEQIVGIQQSSEGYCSTLGRLLGLAPPIHNAFPFATDKAQTILVTHYADLDSYDDVPANGSPSWAIEPDLPWPMQDHDTFLNSIVVKEMLCLEIASGSSSKRPPELRKHPSGTSLLLPGSLRERGEFALVDLKVVPATRDEGNNDDVKKFVWKVSNVDFHHIGDLDT